jgi:hypothetical protein
MIHYTCDRCQQTLPPDDLRYTVRIEFSATMNDAYLKSDEHLDDLGLIDEIEERLDEMEIQDLESLCNRKQYDLCPKCFEACQQNPFQNGVNVNLGFSRN